MQIIYNPLSKNCHIQLKKNKTTTTQQITKDIAVDYNRSGKPIGINIANSYQLIEKCDMDLESLYALANAFGKRVEVNFID